jgi:SPP1 gp7 family putative phage head morphogenesis protein
MAETPQAQRIREAVAEAVKRRDRYAEDRVKALTSALSKAADDVAAQVRRFEDKLTLKPWQQMRVAILKDLQAEIDGVATELRDSWKVGIRDNVAGSMRLGIEDGIGQLEAMQAPDFKDLTDVSRNALVKRTFATIDSAAVDFLANYQIQLLGDVTTELASGIRRAVTAGVLSGKSIPEVAREIGRVVEDKEAFRKAGKTVFKTAQQRATLIARTETLRAHNEGRKVFYRQVGVTRVQWITAHDERTCPVCRSLDGKVFRIDEVDGPPSHASCRCSLAFYQTQESAPWALTPRP